MTWLRDVLVLAALACGCGTTSTDNGERCQEDLTDCGGVCVDTSTDDSHCGECNHQCPGGQVCDGAGVCKLSCSAGLTDCGGTCVDTNTDDSHCGGCDNGCLPSEACAGGICNCVETEAQAQRVVLPADIIMAVDNSGSMADEAGLVRDSMNDFVTYILNNNIRARLVLISADSTDEQGICVPVPLGSGSCPDDGNPPVYHHIVQPVASSNSLDLILGTFDQWQNMLRPWATKTIIVVSDDDSALGAADFTAQLNALDPAFQGFRFNAIVGPYDLSGVVCFPCNINTCASCDPCCGPASSGTVCVSLVANEGTVYKQLVVDTDGVLGDLCTQDFTTVFQEMAQAVISDSRASCIYAIPNPPDGGNIDFQRLNVEFQAAPDSPPELIPNVPTAVDCGTGDGWYYDDPATPSRVIFCDATCIRILVNPGGRVTVKFGCPTVGR